VAVASYTDASAVAAILRLRPDTQLASAVAAGAESISLSDVSLPGGLTMWQGMSLALDQFNPALRETVTITGAITGSGPYTVPTTALQYAHGASAPVKEVSDLADVVGAASRMVDDVCQTAPGAFAQQTWTETVDGQSQTDGSLLVQVSGRNVQSVTSLAWAYGAGQDQNPVDTSAVEIHDYQLIADPSALVTTSGLVSTIPLDPSLKRVQVTVTYVAGYSPIPDDLQMATRILAARLRAAGETGFSDVVGDSAMGTQTFRRGVPADVRAMLRPWMRWS